jgi:hypothetical protein
MEALQAGQEPPQAWVASMSYYFWLGIDADEPYCDGEFTDYEIIEADGFITVHCSGPIRPIPTD